MPQLKVLLMYQPSSDHWNLLRDAAPEAEIRVASDEHVAAAMIQDVDAVLGNRYFLQSLPFARRLRWMQSNSTGVDLILRSGAQLDHLLITRARGVYDDEIAEHALALLLTLARSLHLYRDQQMARRWERHALPRIANMRALILGFGGIGRAIATRLQALEMKVVGASRSGVSSSDSEIPVLGPAEWRAELPQIQALILALPLTSETLNLVGRSELAALPAGAFLVNVGRGGTVDEEALLEALSNDHLGGAALDVFSDEPLPPEHRLWAEPRLVVTPHVARSPESPPFRWEPIFVENLRRFASGEPLLHVVDPERGY